MKKIFIIAVIITGFIFLIGCNGETTNFIEPDFTKLNSEYKQYSLNAYRLIMGFSPDSGTIIAIKETENLRNLVFIDTDTANETVSIQLDKQWPLEQKRVRWSKDGTSFILADAWSGPVEVKYGVKTPGYKFNIYSPTIVSYGDDFHEKPDYLVCSPSFDYTGESVIYSIYNNTAGYTVYASETGINDMMLDRNKIGLASILQIKENKFIETYEFTDSDVSKSTIDFIKGTDTVTLAKVTGMYRKLYIKDYSKDRKRILYFETSLVTQGTNVVGEKIIPRIIEFDTDYEEHKIINIKLPDSYQVLNGVMSPNGRYAVFIVYKDESFIMLLYDINTSKFYELLKNQDIGATFIGSLPGRIDGLFISDDLKICLVTDKGVFIFRPA